MKIYALEGWHRYTPKLDDNDKSENPCSMLVQPMSQGEKLKYSGTIDQEEMTKQPWVAAERIAEVLRMRIRDVVGLTLIRLKDGGAEETQKITDGDAFARHAPEDLQLELFDVILNGTGLKPEQKKNARS